MVNNLLQKDPALKVGSFAFNATHRCVDRTSVQQQPARRAGIAAAGPHSSLRRDRSNHGRQFESNCLSM